MASTTRRALISALPGLAAAPAFAAAPGVGERLARAARAQLHVTTGYDPAYRRIGYPNGDVARSTGVCADVIVRAGRDGLGEDLQRLVHEDMAHAFGAYPSHRVWGLSAPDPNIDHRRVLNLEAFFTRHGGRVWQADGYVVGSYFPGRLEPGDLLTWRLPPSGQGHIGIVVQGGDAVRVVQNIGGGVEEDGLARMIFARAWGRYRWPAAPFQY